MLNSLHIENYVLIKKLDLNFESGFSVITGQTGAGKSILLGALNLVLELYQAGLDGVIVQDIGIAKKIHELLPDLPLHASTQMSVLNLEQAKYLETLGFSRVVLGRELSVEEIEYITKNISMEVEIFVHGALCVCYSGQCLMSSMLGNRSGNRGRCAQPCRKQYDLYNVQDNINLYDIKKQKTR